MTYCNFSITMQFFLMTYCNFSITLQISLLDCKILMIHIVFFFIITIQISNNEIYVGNNNSLESPI